VTGLRRQLMRHLLLATGFVLLLAIPTLGSETADVAAGEAAFARGDFSTAQQVFQELVRQTPGDPELDFLLGRSAYESGDYETAVFAFERVLIADPAADRVRLELGRSYFELGEFAAARSNFEQVLSNHPPETVANNIKRYLQLIERASRVNRINGALSTFLSYDGNVRSAPVEEQIQTIFGSVPLNSEQGDPEEDLISQNMLLLNHLYRQHPRRPGWLSGLLVYNASYFDEKDLNLNLLSLNSGPVWQQENWRGKLQGTFNYLTLDDERYLSSAGLELEEAWQGQKGFSLGLLGSASHLNYATDERDAWQYRLAVKPVWTRTDQRLTVFFRTELNRAREDEQSYLRFLFKLDYERRLPWRLTMNLGGRLQHSQYEDEAPLFAKKRRELLREASIGFSRTLWGGAQGHGELRALLNYVYTDTSSNIDLYEYDKQVLSLGLSYLF
jgi:tetratricopeptide (TPR) repeat protein